MALKIVRLQPERIQDMKKIRVARETYYLAPDGKMYKRGEGVPSGSRLFVRKGSPVEQTAIDTYGIETEEATDVARVPRAGAVAPADRGLGVSTLAEAGYATMDATAEVMQESRGVVEAAAKQGSSQLRQAGMMREQAIKERVAERVAEVTGESVDGAAEPGSLAASMRISGSASALPGGGINEEVADTLERENREAVARSAAPVGKVGDDGKTPEAGDKAEGTAPKTAGANSRTRKVGGGRAAGKRKASGSGK